MNQLPLVSILVPVYRVEKYIERCARSLFEQTYKNLEFIFLDDCSDDGSMAVLERVMKDYPELKSIVHIIHQEKNKGLSTARNVLVEHAKGEFLFHVDSDDWVEPYTVERLVKKQHETNADIVIGRFYEHRDERVTIPLNDGNGLNRDDYLKSLFLLHNTYMVVWGKLIRKDLHSKNDIRWDESMKKKEDHVLFYLVFYASSITHIDEPIYHYNRRLAVSITRSFGRSFQMSEEIVKMTDRICNFFAEKEKFADLALIYRYRFRRYILQESYKSKDKENFKYMASKIGNLPIRLWSIRDNPLLLFFESHYYLAKLIMPLLKLRFKILNVLRKKAINN